MNANDFVEQIRKAVIEDNLAIYRDLFATTEVDAATDAYWVRALSLYAKLEEAERDVLFEFARQVMVDTVSNVFAILDGVSFLEGQEGEISLAIGESREQINGELQDRFLELEEDDGV